TSLRRASGNGLEFVATTDDALSLEPFPNDVAVLLGLPSHLVEDRVDVEELERRFAPALERNVEAFVDRAIKTGALPADGEHVYAHDEQPGSCEPGLVIGRIAPLTLLCVPV